MEGPAPTLLNDSKEILPAAEMGRHPREPNRQRAGKLQASPSRCMRRKVEEFKM